MGCDIHCHIEVKINGQWHHWSAPRVSRDYALFSRMANVRRWEGAPEPISKPRGLPSDGVTIPTEIDWHEWAGDGHSHSWLNGNEMEALIQWHRSYLQKKAPGSNMVTLRDHWGFGLGGEGFGDEQAKEWPVGVEMWRVVFWFDN